MKLTPEEIQNHRYIGAIIVAGLYDEFIKTALHFSFLLPGNEFEKRITSNNPIIKEGQKGRAACEVFKIANRTQFFPIESWENKQIGKFGIF